jgi:ectoine hydroxylase-related dioxygenase (phytanoyl-CoA dioxygenase family)
LAHLDLSQNEVDKILISSLSTQLPKAKDEEETKKEQKPKPHIDPYHSFWYADRHIDEVIKIVNDPDCMSRELDVSYVLTKCRLLVLRNVFDPDMILKKFKPAYTKYLNVLQQQRMQPKHRVIYDPNKPTQRYEIMLPEQLAFKELVRNPDVDKILNDPLVLGGRYFLHSLGTVVTEPGAPHQSWHEEDDYLFSSRFSFDDIGVAGHDLPPYVINLFTPLLNLTHDHGPTEFCVGTSATTGLLRGQFDIYNTTLLEDEVAKQTFYATLNFHRNAVGGIGQKQLPCPPQNLRSVLLNVGDAVLFDYQIIHRAGHNLVENEDTRAQIYIAFARKWFRDLNYDANLVDEDDEAGDPTKYDPFSRQTRFAPETDNKTLFEDTRQEIESLRNIVPQRGAREEGMDMQRVKFVLSNIDLEEGTVFVSVDDETYHSPKALVAPGEHHVIRAKAGSRLSLLDAGGELLKEWKITYDIYQLAVSKEIVGLKEGISGGESSMTLPQQE